MLRNENCISFLLGKAYQHVNQAAKQSLAPYSITPVQFALLNVLWHEDGLSGAEIGMRLQLDSATITGVIDRLENQQLIERRPDALDRRINRIYLTQAATQLQAPLTHTIENLNSTFFAQFTPEEARQLRRALAQLGHVEGTDLEI